MTTQVRLLPPPLLERLDFYMRKAAKHISREAASPVGIAVTRTQVFLLKYAFPD